LLVLTSRDRLGNPMVGLTAAVVAFRDAFSSTALRLYAEARGAGW
jgi:hypothetical protein